MNRRELMKLAAVACVPGAVVSNIVNKTEPAASQSGRHIQAWMRYYCQSRQNRLRIAR